MVEIQARTSLWYLTFVGFSINFLVCINLNIAIVEMIWPVTATEKHSSPEVAQLISNSSEPTALPVPTPANVITPSVADSEHFTSQIYDQNTPMTLITKFNKFHWDEEQQAKALGAFFWTHWLTQIPGGLLARKFGTKLIFGLSNVVGCWLSVFVPMAAKKHLNALIILRLLQGFLTGAAWPAMHNLTAKWIPPNERSKFVSAYYGSSVGVAVFYPLFAFVMHYTSWEWVFYISGVFGTLWWFGWLYFVYDTPAQHPRISATELEHIEKPLLSMTSISKEDKTPWGEILTSTSVWMNVIGQFGGIWALFTLMIQTPTYFNVIHHWDIRAAGIFSGMPHLTRVAFAYIFSLYCDYLLRTNKMSRTNVRKLATCVVCIGGGLFILALAYFGTNRILAIVFITLAMTLHGAGSSGPLSSMIDIAPNYASIILGICGTIGCMPGFISTYIVGIVTLDNKSLEAWSTVFLICAGVLIGSGVVYACFADSTLKPWNGPLLSKKKETKERVLVKDVENCEEQHTNLKERS